MNHLLKILAYGLGGFVLLVGSFVTFSALTGTPMHEMKGVGKLFPEQITVEEGETTMLPDVEEEIQQDRRSPRQLFENAATPLGSFMLEDPFSAEELTNLQKSLQVKLDEVAQRARDLDARERELDSDREHLEDRYRELEKLRTALLEQNADTEAAGQEVDRDREVLQEKEDQTYQKMASLFEDTEAADAANLLTSVYGPEEAAKILVQLEEERVRELIGAINQQMPDESIRYVKALQELRASGAK
ncbi:hypothetical protein Poly30_04850 [Planctomycetes bacterium Poly30]|uniref:Magnesium transporter MgtE intracellular domain-containing protein n=1 Tax=Saltatorellus ferox TaxID=2528018 RepID=A0A518ELM3_9BACT|nr:hypothetical protein Poly30_04850 [Planctomycetes bacterium Poly30]